MQYTTSTVKLYTNALPLVNPKFLSNSQKMYHAFKSCFDLKMVLLIILNSSINANAEYLIRRLYNLVGIYNSIGMK